MSTLVIGWGGSPSTHCNCTTRSAWKPAGIRTTRSFTSPPPSRHSLSSLPSVPSHLFSPSTDCMRGPILCLLKKKRLVLAWSTGCALDAFLHEVDAFVWLSINRAQEKCSTCKACYTIDHMWQKKPSATYLQPNITCGAWARDTKNLWTQTDTFKRRHLESLFHTHIKNKTQLLNKDISPDYNSRPETYCDYATAQRNLC